MSDTKQLAFSAAQIDAILAAAQRCSNRNLLDNWYFGNPVDQRGGYVVPPNTAYYSDTALSTQVGTVSAYTKAVKVNDTYCTITVDSTTYYVAWSNAVRGYTGTGYGPDRWFLENVSSTKFVIELHEGFIRLVQESVTETYRWQAIYQSIGDTAKSIAGKVITVSLLHRGTGQTQLYLTKQNTPNAFANQILTNTTDWQVSTLTATVPDDATDVCLRIYADVTGSLGYTDVKAIKLELGNHQTLAHQDADGNWVINEIPDYGQELAKCQRYYQLYSSADKRPVKTVDCRPTMRVDPVQGTIVIDGTTYYYNSAEL